jgi:cytochrome b561
MKNFGIFAVVVLLVFTQQAYAAGAPNAVPGWIIQKESSTIEFEGVQQGAPFKGRFKNFEGRIDFDANDLAHSKADITIPIDGIDAGNDDRNENLPRKDWFDTARFPEAHFVTTSIEKGLDRNTYVAKGNLTIRDVTLPVTLPFTLDITKNEAGEAIAVMKAETSVNRLDFGIGQGQWKDTKSVENQVKIIISLTAKQRLAQAPL